LVVSIAVGFSHILLAPAPNWRYMIHAFIAGRFYDAAFLTMRESGRPLSASTRS
jgi:hypothetical protein